MTTSVTNLDIHDIARSCRTYGVKRVLYRDPGQGPSTSFSSASWDIGSSRSKTSSYNPDRASALSLARLCCNSWQEAREEIARRGGTGALTGRDWGQFAVGGMGGSGN